jgi:hypothetical protein
LTVRSNAAAARGSIGCGGAAGARLWPSATAGAKATAVADAVNNERRLTPRRAGWLALRSSVFIIVTSHQSLAAQHRCAVATLSGKAPREGLVPAAGRRI